MSACEFLKHRCVLEVPSLLQKSNAPHLHQILLYLGVVGGVGGDDWSHLAAHQQGSHGGKDEVNSALNARTLPFFLSPCPCALYVISLPDTRFVLKLARVHGERERERERESNLLEVADFYLLLYVTKMAAG